MKLEWIVAGLTVVLIGTACGDSSPNDEASAASAPASDTRAAGDAQSKQAAFSEADLDRVEQGLRREIEAVNAPRQKAAAASTAQERGAAMQAQWETATIPLGAEASGLSESRYREIREGVDRVFTTLDFQGKIDGPLSIDLERADPATKARVSGDAFADLPPAAAAALRARMDRLVPVWSEYKTLVAVAG